MTTFAGTTISTTDSTDARAGADGKRISRPPNITDQYSGLLNDLTADQRRGLVAKLSTGYYDGWRPTRAELTTYIQREFGVTPRDHHRPQWR